MPVNGRGFGVCGDLLATLFPADSHLRRWPRSWSEGRERANPIEAERRDGSTDSGANPNDGEQRGSEPYRRTRGHGLWVCRAVAFRDQRLAATSAVSEESMEGARNWFWHKAFRDATRALKL